MKDKTTGGSALRVVDLLTPCIEQVGSRDDVQPNELGFALLYMAATSYIAAYRLHGALPKQAEFLDFARMTYAKAEHDISRAGLHDRQPRGEA